jgi:hypothetical protein
MANFFTDTPQFKHYLDHPLMKRIVELRERNYIDKNTYDYAPLDFEDALDSYEKVLEVVGEICGEIIEPNAEEVDKTGPTLHNGRVQYAPQTQENLDALVKAELMGMTFPRRYGGLNFSMVPYMMSAEIVSRADASFQNIWMLQDCGETIYEFGSEEQKNKYLPRIIKGETMSMDLTEPDAGSDLQSVMLKATYNEAEDQWYLNGWDNDMVSGIEVLVNDFNKLDRIAQDLFFEMSYYKDRLGNTLFARSIKDINPMIFNWLSLLDMNVWVIIILMIVVSGFTMISGLLIIILERTNMIGMLKAMGARDFSIRKVFLYLSAFLIGQGMLWGNIIGLSLCFIQDKFHIIKLNPSVYYLSAVPIDMNALYLILLNLGTLIVSLLMMIGPSYLVAKITPAKSIQFE